MQPAKYDLYDIQSRLKDQFPTQFVRIDWKDEQHKIICQDAHGKEYIAMSVPHGQLDARVIHRMQEINPERGYNPFDELDQWFNEREQTENRRIESIAADFADNFRRPLIEDYLY